MTPIRTLRTLVASALLGVIAVASLVSGAFMFFAAWATRSVLDGPASELGTGAAALIGVLLIGFSGLAAISARDTWQRRPYAGVLGLLVGIVTTLAAAVTLVVATVTIADALYYAAIGLGIITTVAVLVDAFRTSTTDELARRQRPI
jgi:hypothetical protein